VDYLSILFSPSGSRAASRVPSTLVDQYMEDAAEQGFFVEDRSVSREGLPVLHVAGDIAWQGPRGKRDLQHALDVLATKNPQVVADVKRDASGNLVFTLDQAPGRTT
jgi:hypothetical protein